MQRGQLDARAADLREKGFSLIELMVVILIISILIAIAIPQHQIFVGGRLLHSGLQFSQPQCDARHRRGNRNDSTLSRRIEDEPARKR